MNILYVNSLEASNKELARQLASANVLIAEQNKLAKERQEWALHTNEVIRSLNQQLAAERAQSVMLREAIRKFRNEPALGRLVKLRATYGYASLCEAFDATTYLDQYILCKR